MATGIYATWQDVYGLLRKAEALHYGTVEEPEDTASLTAILSFVHQDFEAELRMMSSVAVPIDEEISPDMFEAAKIICARRGTAEFLRQANQNQGKDPEDWYVNWLEDSAGKLMTKLQSPHGRPEDAPAAGSPRAYLPKVSVVTGTEDMTDRFGLSNIESGTSNHW